MWPPMNPRVSIVTPSFNQARFLEAAIQSVLQQECESLDYRVLDGGSQDGSVELLRRYDSQLRWVSEPDAGQSDAVNRGFQQSSGEILGWLNADDVYCSGALKEVVRQFSGDPGLMLLYGDAHHIDENGKFLDDYPTREFDLSTLAYHCFICQPACFFRRRLLEAAGGIDTRLRYAMDLDLWIRFGQQKKQNPKWRFKHIPQVLALSRMHCHNKTLSRRHHAFEEMISVVEKHFGVVPFNWVYGAEESNSGAYDGYFRKRPLSLSLLGKSLARWSWINRKAPSYLAACILDRLRSPRQSVRALAKRSGGPS